MSYTDFSKEELHSRIQELEVENTKLKDKLNDCSTQIQTTPSAKQNNQIELLHALLDVSRDITHHKNFKDSAHTIFKHLKKLIRADGGYIALLDKFSELNEIVYLDQGNQVCSVNPDLPMPVRGYRKLVYQSKKVMYHNDFANSKWMRLLPKGHSQLNNIMFVPMIVDDSVIGLIGMSNKKGGFNDEDAKTAAEFSKLAVIALEYSESIEESNLLKKHLRSNEERFRLMTENSPVLIWESGLDAKCTYFNKNWLNFRGRKMDEEIGNGWLEGLHPDDYHSCVNGYLDAFKKQVNFELQYRLKNHQGEYRWILDYGVPLYDSLDNFKGYIGSCIDITERKIVEQIQKEKEEFYYALFEKNKAVKLLIDPADGKIADANSAAANYYGYSVDVLKNMKITQINQLSEKEVFEGMQQAKTENRTFFEFVHKLADGSLRDVIVYSGPITFKGKKLLHSIVTDITDQKEAKEALRQSEEKYRDLYENTPVMLHSINNEGKLISVSNFWLGKLGYTKQEVIGRKSLEFLTPESQEKFHKYFPEFIEKGEIKEMAYQMVKKNGEIIDVLLSAISEKNTDGTLKRSLAVIIDVTEQKRAEKELKKAYNLYRTLVSNLPGINAYLFDRDKRIIIAEGAEFKKGIYSRSDFEGRNVTELNLEKHVRDYLDHMFTAALQGKDISSELNYKDSWYFHIAVPVKDHKNKILGGISVSQDITTQKRSFIEIDNYKDKLKQLTRHLQQIIEQEKTALAREIHDDLGQNLTFVKLNLSLLQKKLTRKYEKTDLLQLANAYDMINKTIKKVKKVTSELRPALIDDLGIVPAIEWKLSEFSELTGVKCNFKYNTAELEIGEDLSINLFRILQEALNNCVKYTKATVLDVSLEQNNAELVFTINNNGIGIKKSETEKLDSYGIIGMRERVELFEGTFEIQGTNKGTFIIIKIPLKKIKK